MNTRSFIIEGQTISIDNALIKNYYAYPECFVKDGNELYVFNGKIFVSEDGDYCTDEDCRIIIPNNLVDAQGNQLCQCADDFLLDSVKGFIHNYKLYLVDSLEEVSLENFSQ